MKIRIGLFCPSSFSGRLSSRGGRWWLALMLVLSTARADELEETFLHPPDSAKPGVLWMWMGSNISKAGITRDLEALKDAGYGRATMFSLADTCTPWAGEIRGAPTPEIVAWTEPWWEMVRFAAEEARRLELDFGMFNGPGYTASGGPWITPEFSMQSLCWSETAVTGGGVRQLRLARPKVDLRAEMTFPIYNGDTGLVEKPEIPARKTYFRDIAVVAVPSAGVIGKDRVIDLSGRLNAEDELEWDAPAGEWTVYRFGHTTKGTLMQPAQWKATGLECDKISAEAVTFHMKYVIGEIQKHLGDLIGTGFTHVHFDSYEAGEPTWTPKMRQEFAARRGYDLLPFLATFAKRMVGSEGDTAKFAADYAATIKDLYRDVYFTTVANMLAEAKLTFLCEPYGGPWRQDDVMPLVGRVMTEFWTHGGKFSPYELEPTVAALRKSGQNVVEAEAFTGDPRESQWSETPAWLKPIGDAAFCAGVNRMVLHRFVHQPWDERYLPGNTMGQWGTHFDRTQTWWEPAKAMVSYWQRCQALLQWGAPSTAPNDFGATSASDGMVVRAIRRRSDSADVYFVANQARANGTALCEFDVTGRQPELWDPLTGARRPLTDFSTRAGKTLIPLQFADSQSWFVVFRQAPQSGVERSSNFAALAPVLSVPGPWEVKFDPKWGGPEQPVEFESLTDWTARPEAGVRYFSGTAVYRTTFAVNPAVLREPEFSPLLDLGVVHHIARVKLNGEDLGVAWCAPWQIAIKRGLLKSEGNELTIEVTNVWANRLIGDEQEAPDAVWGKGHMGFGGPLAAFPQWFLAGEARGNPRRFTFTTWNYFTKDSPLVPSGLLGPVRVLAARR